MPNGLSDGAIIIDTGLNNSKFFTDANAWKAALQGMKQTAQRISTEMGKSGGAYMKSVQNNMKANREFRSQMAALEKQAQTLRNAIDKPGTGSKAYKAVEVEIKQVEAAMDEALKKRDSFINARGGVTDAAGYSAAAKQVQQYGDRLTELNAQRDRLANPTGDDIAQYQQRVNAYNQVAAKLAEMRQVANEAGGGFAVLMRNAGTAAATIARIAGNGALSFLRKLASGAKNAAIQLAKLAGRAVTNGLKKVGQFAAGAAKSILHLGRGARKSGNGFQFSLKNMLKYGLGIRSLFVLFNRLRSAIKEGFGELANYDPRVRAALASLKGALGGLKGSLSAAFAPILTAVAPALTTLINLLTQAVNAIGMFFAAITGQGYYTAAKGLSAVGSAAGGAGGSVKELKRQLAGFDELNILTANDGGGGGGGGGGGSGVNYTFDKVPIAEGIQNFVDEIKELFANGKYEEIGRVIAGGINQAIQKAQDFIKWDNLGPAITRGVNALTGAINGLFDGVNWANLGATFAEGLNTITNTLLLWYRGIDWLSIGKAIGEALNGLIERVNWPNLGKLVSEKAHSLILTLKGAITTIQWGDAAKKFASAINAFFKNKKLFKDAGDTINAAFKGLFEWSNSFLDKFDEIEAAKSIREALGRIQWGDIAGKFWETVKTAFKKAGNFLTVILGGEVQGYGLSVGDAISEKLAIKKGKTNQTSSLGATIGKALNTALKTGLDTLTDFVENKINWTNIGLKIRKELIDFFNAIDWTDLGTKFANAAMAILGGIGDLIYAAIYGETPYKTRTELTEQQKEIKEKYGAYVEESKEGKSNEGKLVQFLKEKQITPEQWNDYVSAEEETRQGYRGFWDEVVNLFDRRAYGEEDSGAMEYAKKNAKALENNTKATEESRKAFEEAGGDLKGWDALYTTDSNRTTFKMAGGDLEGWDALFNDEQTVNVGVNYTPKGAGGTTYTNNPLGWLTKVFAPGTDTKTRVELIRQGFTTVAQWVGIFSGGDVNKPVGLLRNAFTTIENWLTGGYMGGAVNKSVGLSNDLFGTISGWLSGGYMGGAVNKSVGLLRSAFTTIQTWLTGNYMGGDVNKSVGLSSTLFGTIAGWLLGGFMGGDVTKGIGITNDGWATVAAWIIAAGWGGDLTKGIGITNVGWATVAHWIFSNGWGGDLYKQIFLTNQGTNWANGVADWIQNGADAIKLKVSLIASAVTGAVSGKAEGGAITASGRQISFAAGGMVYGSGRANWWNSARKYAAGTSRAHGTVFVAGEAGPEVVGHVNGRTEILNKSQLAQTMYVSVANGMLAALKGMTFTMPAMATGGVMPYEVSAQIARSTAEIESTLNANNEDLIQTIINVAGQIVAALNRQNSPQPVGAGGMTADQVIAEINRRTLMFGASPLKGV